MQSLHQNVWVQAYQPPGPHLLLQAPCAVADVHTRSTRRNDIGAREWESGSVAEVALVGIGCRGVAAIGCRTSCRGCCRRRRVQIRGSGGPLSPKDIFLRHSLPPFSLRDLDARVPVLIRSMMVPPSWRLCGPLAHGVAAGFAGDQHSRSLAIGLAFSQQDRWVAVGLVTLPPASQ